MIDLAIWCGDIGSVKKRNFGCCRAELSKDNNFSIGTSIKDFADGIAKYLSKGYKVSLGFECPLFLPILDGPSFLTSARKSEKHRAWSARAGCRALVTGLTETTWILSRINEVAKAEIRVTFSWKEFTNQYFNLFI